MLPKSFIENIWIGRTGCAPGGGKSVEIVASTPHKLEPNITAFRNNTHPFRKTFKNKLINTTMRLRSRLQLLYFLFGTSFVLSTGLGGRFVGTVGDFNTERISHQSDEYTEDSSQSEYETTVTTNMAYGSARGISASRVAKAPTAPKSSKAAKGGHDIEYEYIPGGEYAPSAPSASVFSGKDGTKGSKAAKSSKKSKDNTKSGIKSTKAAKSAKSAKSKGATAAPSPCKFVNSSRGGLSYSVA